MMSPDKEEGYTFLSRWVCMRADPDGMRFVRRPPYGSHSGSRHACQKRPTSQCGWARRAAAQTVVAQRVQGDAGKALLRDRGNESLRRRLSEGAPSRGAHAGDGFIVGGTCSRAKTWLANELSVVKSGGKEVSHIEKNSDVCTTSK